MEGPAQFPQAMIRLPGMEYQILAQADLIRANEDGCPICMNNYAAGALVVRTPCMHCYHYACLMAELVQYKET